MTSDPYRRDDGEPAATDATCAAEAASARRRPAARPARVPAADYGVRPEAPGLRREPWMADADVAGLPVRWRGQSYADWLAERARYVEGLRAKRATASPEPTGAPTEPPPSAPLPAAAKTPPAADKPAPLVVGEGDSASSPPAAVISASAADSADRGPARQCPPAPPAKPEMLLTRRQERFCQLFVVLGNASAAAWQAGYSFPERRNQGYRLLRRPAVRARISELQRGLAQALDLNAEVVLGKLESIYQQAIEGQYFNAAARIVEVQARIAGHLRSRVAPPRQPPDDDK